MPAPIHLLINPAAGSGHARERVERAYAALRTIGPVVLAESLRPRDETRLAVEAARASARALVVLGGDGSVSHAARGLISAQAETPLAVLAAGTGNDVVKSLGWPAHDYLGMARRIADGQARRVDAGEIDGTPFVNAAGFGFDVEVLQRMAAPSRMPLRGTARYVSVALRQLFAYQGVDAEVPPLDASTRRWLTVVFANGQWFGGAFRIAPNARIDDGLLDVVGITNAPALTRASLFARALRGAHVGHPAVRAVAAAELEVECADRPFIQIDGELQRASGRRVRVRCLPGALRVIA